jgi:hypothetical protein
VARYYFHIKDGAKLIYDLEGSEHPDLPAARVHALKIARDTWADAIKFKVGHLPRTRLPG